jgi:hypothetical protein
MILGARTCEQVLPQQQHFQVCATPAAAAAAAAAASQRAVRGLAIESHRRTTVRAPSAAQLGSTAGLQPNLGQGLQREVSGGRTGEREQRGVEEAQAVLREVHVCEVRRQVRCERTQLLQLQTLIPSPRAHTPTYTHTHTHTHNPRQWWLVRVCVLQHARRPERSAVCSLTALQRVGFSKNQPCQATAGAPMPACCKGGVWSPCRLHSTP